MEQLSFLLSPQDALYTVSELTAEIKNTLGQQFADVRVAGEISGKRVYPSGHVYFTLKDAGSQLSCVMFRNSLRYLKFQPEDGLAVVARGSLDVFEARGQYQLIVSTMEPQGFGAMQLAFEQLKRKLEGEGLFETSRKRTLPRFPKRIGIVTSPAGAVIRDMINIFTRRFPGLQLRLYPTQVQGEGAAAGICEGLAYFGRSAWADVVIVGRGGGSLEDLWAFNEESVARAIAACPIPVVSAVGHETDFTIADFVADLRAPTPSAAAELVAPNRAEIEDRLTAQARRGVRAIELRIAQAARRIHELGTGRATAFLHRRVGRALQAIDEHERRMRAVVRTRLDLWRRQQQQAERALAQRDPRLRLARSAERLGTADRGLAERMRRLVAMAERRLEPTASRLEALSPLRVLGRGYALVETKSGKLVRRPVDAPPSTEIRIRLAEGQVEATVVASDSSGADAPR